MGGREVAVSAAVGVVANPASARDIRRIVAHGGAITTHDKLNQLRRVMSGLSVTGVERVISMADRSGLMAGLARAANGTSANKWPSLEFVDQPITHSAADTVTATQAMTAAGVGSIVVLGGDGTNRLVAAEAADTPIVSISTGTNNGFPNPVEPTVAGMAAGLIATNQRCRQAGTYRAKKLEVRTGDRVELALVDVAISSNDAIGSGALWDVAEISELYLSFAEPGTIGLSAIGAHLQPTSRRAATGLRVALCPGSPTKILAPIAPGLVTPVGIRSVSVLEPQSTEVPRTQRGVIAIDGERLLRFGPTSQPTITLRPDGPVVVDVEATITDASNSGLLRLPPDVCAPANPNLIARPTTN